MEIYLIQTHGSKQLAYIIIIMTIVSMVSYA